MAAAVVTNTVLDLPTQGRWSLVAYTPSTSYATGGEVITPAQLGVKQVFAIIPLGNLLDGTIVTVVGSSKLKLVVPTTGAEVANAVDKSAQTIQLLVLGSY